MQVLELIAGVVLIGLILYDVFQSVLLPRPAVGRVRLSPRFTRALWQAWRAVSVHIGTTQRREAALAAFAPVSVVTLLAVWAAGLVVGFGLILFALGDELAPARHDLPTCLYTSGLALFTLGFADTVPAGTAARTLVLIEAATGLGVVAIVISLLFSLFNAFQRREVPVVVLEAIAGAPPSAVRILETCARHGMPQQLERIYIEWARWSAEVLESHLAYPMLAYFRSSHDNEAWLNSFTVVMDAALLSITTVEGASPGPAQVMVKVGEHLVEDLTWYFRFGHEHLPGVAREDFEAACDVLEEAGYAVRDRETAWSDYSARRTRWAGPVSSMASHLAIPPVPWIGERSYLPHSDRSGIQVIPHR